MQLAELPESFGQLTKLTTLDLFHNRLLEIPECLEMLKMLTRLDLGEVCFSCRHTVCQLLGSPTLVGCLKVYC